MNPTASHAGPDRDEPPWSFFLAAGLIVASAAIAYRNVYPGAFLYDDTGSIVNNPTIRNLASSLVPPPGGLPVTGRPLVNFSFALNYALGGLSVGGFHAANAVIHALAGLTLWGIARQTLARDPRVNAWMGGNTAAAAFLIGLLWTVHPLQTEAVTYLSQRAESLMGLWYLLTLYCFIRGAARTTGGISGPASSDEGVRERDSPRWLGLSVGACLLGMASKEVMVTAPVAVFLYDCVFVAGGPRIAWKRRRAFYLALAATWILLACLVAGSAGRGGTAGFGSSVAWWAYAFTQFRAIALYFRLSLWPRPLLFSYGLILGGPPWAMSRDVVGVMGMALGTLFLLRKRSPLGFLGAWFFLTLAPSSSVVPVSTEIIAEHRAYLPLAAILAAVVCGGYAAARRLWGRSRPAEVAVFLAGLAAASVLTAATIRRNRAYENVLTLWADTVAKMPDNAGARNNYGNALAEQGRLSEAIEQYRAALRLVPGYNDPFYNLGNALAKSERWGEAAELYREALRRRPEQAEIHYGLGLALGKLGQTGEAERQYEAALAGKSNVAEIWYNLGNGFLDANRLDLAAAAFGRAVRLRPDYADALVNYGGVLAQLGRDAEAVEVFQAVLRLEPGAPDVHNNLGGLLAKAGRLTEARAQFEEAVRLKPDYAEARDNLERVRIIEQGRGRP